MRRPPPTPALRQPAQHAGGGVDEVEFAVDSFASVVDVALDELDVRVGLGSEVAGVVDRLGGQIHANDSGRPAAGEPDGVRAHVALQVAHGLSGEVAEAVDVHREDAADCGLVRDQLVLAAVVAEHVGVGP